MGRSPCCSKEAGLNRGSWTALEDKILTDYIKIHGEGRWRNLPQKAGLKRCGKSCRLRWLNYLRPDIKRGNISQDEEELIIRLHKLLGNRWSLIAGRLPGRTDNEIKNYWNTNLGKKFLNQSPNGKNKLGVNIIPCHASNKSENNYPTVSASDPPSPAHVVRTRAVKCTKVLLSNDDVLGKSGHCNSAGPVCYNEPAGLGSDGNVVNNVSQAASEPAANSIFDAEDELFLADFFLGSEFPRGEDYFGDVSCYVKDDLDRDHYNHGLRFPEELTVPDWSGSSNNVGVVKEQSVGPSFCFNSFLGSEDDWLAAD